MDLQLALAEIVGEAHVSTAESVLNLHSGDQSSHTHRLPDVVVWPGETAEVSAIAKFAYAQKIPLVGWGAGSSLEGNSNPITGES